jgi:hypothetical protein
MGMMLRSAIVLVLAAGSMSCAPKDPKPGDPHTRESAMPQGHESSTARMDSGEAPRPITRCDDKSSGPSSGRLGAMPLMNHIA